MSTAVAPPRLACDEVLRIAQADAQRVYRDLTHLAITLRLESDGWHVEYNPSRPGWQGGGPCYVIDPVDGTIISKTYYQ